MNRESVERACSIINSQRKKESSQISARGCASGHPGQVSLFQGRALSIRSVTRRLERATKGENTPGSSLRAVIKRLLLALALAMFNNYNGRERWTMRGVQEGAD